MDYQKIILAILALVSMSFSIDVGNCSELAASGTYDLTNDVAGAPYFVFSPTPAYACMKVTGSNIVLDCHGYDLTDTLLYQHAFGIIVQGTNITVKNCGVQNYTWGVELLSSQYSVISNVTVLNSQYSGFVADNSMYNLFSGNTACHNGDKGFETNAFISNTYNNIFDGNTACYNSAFGFQISGLNNTISNNIAHDNGYSGITSGSSNLIVNNTAYNHPQAGIIAGNDNVTGNTAYNNSYAGFLSSGGNNLSRNDAHGNSRGVFVSSSGSSMSENEFCANTEADVEQSYYYTSGNSGVLNSCDSTINWNDAGAAGCQFSCDDDGVPGYLDNCPGIYNPGQEDSDGDGTGDACQCPDPIDAPGTYSLDRDVLGASNDAAPLYGKACVLIESSDVVFDCAGHGMKSLGGGSDYGILASGPVSNVTVKGCPLISGYSHGVYLLKSDGGALDGVSVTGSAFEGFTLNASDGNLITGSNSSGNKASGFYLYGSSGNTLAYDYSHDNAEDGFRLHHSPHNVLHKDVAASNNPCVGSLCQGTVGFNVMLDSDYNLINDSEAYNNGAYGFSFSGSKGNNATNNRAYGKDGIGQNGFNVWTEEDALLVNNTAYDGKIGFGFVVSDGSSNVTLADNSARNFSLSGFFVTSASGILLTGNMAQDNAQNGFALSFARNVSLLDNKALGNKQSGFSIQSRGNNTLVGNLALNNTQNGFRLASTANNTLTGNTAASNTTSSNGFLLTASSGNTLSGNSAYNTRIGFSLSSSNNNTLTGNAASNGTSLSSNGFDLTGSSFNTLTGNNAYNVSNVGFSLSSNSNRNALSGNSASKTSTAFNLFRSSNNNVTGNTAYPGSAGFALLTLCENNTLAGNLVTGSGGNAYIVGFDSRFNTLVNNTAYNTNFTAFSMAQSSNNTIANNSAVASRVGFGLSGSSNNILSGNTAYGNSIYGFSLFESGSNALSGNTASDSANDGFSIQSNSNGNLLSGNTAHNSTPSGFSLRGSYDNVLSDNTASGNGYGFSFLGGSSGNALSGGSSHGNAQAGIRMSSGSNPISSVHLYGNGRDLLVNGTDVIAGLSGVLFDNPAGDMRNSTNLSLDDSVEAGSAYYVNWSAQPAPLPDNYVSLEGRFVTIANLSGNVSIDSMTWSWLDSELDESSFELWQHNGAWSMIGAALDTSANTLSMQNLSPQGVYGILEENPDDDLDGVCDAGRTSALCTGSDQCPGSVPDPMEEPNPRHYAQTIGFAEFEVGPDNDESLVYDQNATYGCTCSQIVDALGGGEGTKKNGCTRDIMEQWTGLSAQPDWDAGIGSN